MKDGTRSVKHKASLGRRILSATLAIVMCFSMMQVVAFASDDGIATQADMQIEHPDGVAKPVYYSWDAKNGTFINEEPSTDTDPIVKNNNDPEKEKVSISKTITATGKENVFDIHLKVETTEKIETTTKAPDAAVVLVLDISTSMSACTECGKKYDWEHSGRDSKNHNTGCKYGGGNVVEFEHTRLKAAREASKEFLTTYAGFEGDTFTAPGAARKVAIVTYYANASEFLGWTEISGNTKDEANTKLNDVKGKIDTINFINLGTNTDDGLKKAQELLSDSDNIGTIDNKFLVLMTDGEPVRKTDDNLYSPEYGNLEGYPSDSGYASDIYKNPARRAYYIRNTLNTEFYSICLNADGISDWLNYFSDKCVSAENSSQLRLAFRELIVRLRMAVDAWKVTDPMGEHITYVGLKEGTHKDGAVTDKGNTLIWDLRKDLTSESTTIKDNTITYTLNYTVKLDTKSISDFEEYYLTNGETKLVYYLTETTTTNGVDRTDYVDDEGNVITGTEKLLTLHFKVPAVKGYVANMTFNKVSSHDKSGLKDCTFKLTHNAGCTCGENIGNNTATSMENGSVTFNRILSGHVYTLTEESAPSGYDKNTSTSAVTVSYGDVKVTGDLIKDGVVTNTPSAEPKVFTVIKNWTGAESVDEVTVYIHKVIDGDKNGPIAATLKLGKANNWTASVELPTIDVATKTEIVYRAVEVGGDNYKLLSGGDFDVNRVAKLTNVRTGTNNIIIQKNWAAPSNLRPAVTVRLLQDGVTFGEYTLSSGNWSKTVSVPTYSNAGKAYEYTVVELDANRNAVSDSGSITVNGHTYNVSISGTTVTNTLDQEYTSVSGIKTWNVAGLTDAEKSALSATITLYQNGNVYKTAEVTYADNTYSFVELPKYTEDRTAEYSYTVEETAVSGNTSGTWAKTQNGTNFTNTITDQVTISGTKTWVDPDESERPASITIKLMSGNTVVDSRTISARPVAEATAEDGTEGETDPVNEDPAVEYTWEGVDLSYSFTVPKYDASGAVIPYNIVEENVPMYQATYDGYNVTNTLNGGEKTISAQKIWVDAAGEHNAVTVGVYRDGSDTQAAVIELNQENKWAGSVKVPKYDGGAEINYIVREINSDGIAIEANGSYGENYTVSYEKTGDNWIVKNQINQELISVSGQKTWVGSGEHPAVTFTLYKNGVSTGQTRTQEDLNAENGNLFTFEGLEKYTFSGDTCTVNTYTIKETMSGTPVLLARYGYYGTPVMGTVDNDGVFQFVNTFTNDETSVSGQKTWYGMGYTAEVNVGLFTGGEMISSQTTEELKFNFTGLTKYNADGTLVKYSIFELDDQNKPMDKGPYYTSNGEEYEVHYNGYNIDNILKQKTTSVPVTKVWRGASAESVTFELYRAEGENGTPAAVLDADGLPMTLTLTAEDIDEETGFWKGSFEGLDVYNASRTAEYVYSVKESGVENGTVTLSGNTYTAEAVEGNIFVNTIVDPNTGTFTVNKAWAGEGYNAENGEAVTVQLFANNVAYGEPVTLDKDNDWTHTFNNLPLYSAETYSPLTYTVGELDENGALVADGGIISMNDGAERYVVTYNGGTITNTLKDADSYKYRVLRNYTYSYDGKVSNYTDYDQFWTVASKDEVINIDASQWTDCSTDDKDVIYGFVQTDVYQGTNNEYAFTQDGSVASFVTEKYVDGESWYEVYLFYNYSYSTPPYIPPYIPPVDPPVDPPQEPPVTPPEEPVITPEEPDVPAGDKDIDDPLHNLNDGDIPMEGLEIEDPNVPKTADESNVNTWMLIALLSGMALAVSVLTERRQFKHKA